MYGLKPVPFKSHTLGAKQTAENSFLLKGTAFGPSITTLK
jgi:hypothetical protein